LVLDYQNFIGGVSDEEANDIERKIIERVNGNMKIKYGSSNIKSKKKWYNFSGGSSKKKSTTCSKTRCVPKKKSSKIKKDKRFGKYKHKNHTHKTKRALKNCKK